MKKNQNAEDSQKKQQEIEKSDYNLFDKFFVAQYETLRKEIENAKSRIFRIQSIGVIGIPSAYAAASAAASVPIAADSSSSDAYVYAANLLLIILPIFIFIAMMSYFSEMITIMRCGKYIKENMEKEEEVKDKIVWWETWLEHNSEEYSVSQEFTTRLVDILVFFPIALLSIIGYLGFAYNGFFIVREWDEIAAWLVGAGYLIFGILYLLSLRMVARFAISTSEGKGSMYGLRILLRALIGRKKPRP